MRQVTVVLLVGQLVFADLTLRDTAISSRGLNIQYNTTSSRSATLLNVHLVPHSHDDVGWLKTVDELYYGLKNNIQRAQVKNLLSAVVESLSANPDRRFIVVEQAFFQMWWDSQKPAVKELTRQLVQSGQLEFINGGWSMHDETDNTYAEQIDQTTLGHRFILSEFNVTPKTTWQIDPWGHTAFQATYMSSPLAGFNAVYYGRIDWQEAEQRKAAKTTETVWAPSASLGLTAATLGGLLFNVYEPPPGFDMSEPSTDAPFCDDPSSPSYNVPELVEAFVLYAKSQAQAYRGNDILFTMGSDFYYENADTWFSNMDAIIHYVNLDGRINVLYSTPSIYTDAKLASVPSWSLNTADYVPYSEYAHAFHTGSFTSRASLKGYIRESSSLSAAARLMQLLGVRPMDLGPSNPLYRLERALGIAQHHDAVAGTSKQAVAYDYARRIAEGVADVENLLIPSAITSLTNYTPSGSAWASCDLANATICPALGGITVGETIAVVIFNSRAQTIPSAPVLLPVPIISGGGSFVVADATSTPIVAQLLPLSPSDVYLREIYYAYGPAASTQWLAFTAGLPPGGYTTVFITAVASSSSAPLTFASVAVPVIASAGLVSINNSRLTLTFDSYSGLLTSYTDSDTGVTSPLSQDLRYYEASAGNWLFNLPAAGAYFMRPIGNDTIPVGAPATLTFVQGPVVSEARQVFGSWASQTFRLWSHAADVQLQFDVGPVNVQDGIGKEIVSVIGVPGMVTEGTFYTDSNGRDTMTRVRNERPSFNYTVLEPIAGNFYPVNIAYVRDASSGLTLSVVTDRAEGGSSILDGELQVVVQRRLLHDDHQGVAEPLDELGLTGNGIVVRGLHRFALANSSNSAALRRGALADQFFRPVLTFAPLPPGVPPSQWVTTHRAEYTGLSAPLPTQLHLLTTHAQSPTEVLLRLSHSFEAGEDSQLSLPASASLGTLFAEFSVSNCTEMTVTANQPLSAAPKVTYRLDNGTSVTLPIVPTPPSGVDLTVTLSPMEIRTFMCSVTAVPN